MKFYNGREIARMSLDKLKGRWKWVSLSRPGRWRAGGTGRPASRYNRRGGACDLPPLPWSENSTPVRPSSVLNLDEHLTKYAVREVDGGNKVLVKTTEGSSVARVERGRTWGLLIYPTTPVEADR